MLSHFYLFQSDSDYDITQIADLKEQQLDMVMLVISSGWGDIHCLGGILIINNMVVLCWVGSTPSQSSQLSLTEEAITWAVHMVSSL